MDLSPFLLAWRTATLPDREVIDALVHPAHVEPSPELAAALQRWPGTYYWSHEPEGRHLVLTRPLGRRRREAWAPPLLLVPPGHRTHQRGGGKRRGDEPQKQRPNLAAAAAPRAGHGQDASPPPPRPRAPG